MGDRVWDGDLRLLEPLSSLLPARADPKEGRGGGVLSRGEEKGPSEGEDGEGGSVRGTGGDKTDLYDQSDTWGGERN